MLAISIRLIERPSQFVEENIKKIQNSGKFEMKIYVYNKIFNDH